MIPQAVRINYPRAKIQEVDIKATIDHCLLLVTYEDGSQYLERWKNEQPNGWLRTFFIQIFSEEDQQL